MTNSVTEVRDLFPGYSISACIYDGARTIVYRGVQDSTGKPVVLKLLRESSTSPKQLGRLRLEHQLLEKVSIDGVAKAIGTIHHKGHHALILDDAGGMSLDQHMRAGTWKPPHSREQLATFLRIAESVAETLARVHETRVIHKDVKPHNIVFNVETSVVKLIDFDVAALVASEAPELLNPSALEGTLEYLSPEQTGRMNRAIDHRSDLYSLGITFFHLLTGQVPFSNKDALELLHAHMAKIAPSVHALNPDIPSVLSDIVAKLTAKAPEDRYQSAHGLRHDLALCRRAIESTGEIAHFVLGERDSSLVFQIGSKLYGREGPTAALLECFAQMATGSAGSAMAIVSGYSGIGKSAIINEIHRPLTRERGIFISGKFDQYKRNVPYSSFVQAFEGLIRHILTESDENVSAWKAKILSAVRSHGQVLIEVIPELERIIGPQPPLEPLGAAENQIRFDRTFRDFCAVFCRKEHPLVLFLDDLQWADSPTLGLLRALVTDPDIRYLFFVGAYRDNEVDDKHPLMSTLKDIEKVRPYRAIELAALELAHVTDMIADCLHSSVEHVRPLAEHVYGKTRGNPFFVRMFLGTLAHDGHLRFDMDRGHWGFDLAKIEAMAITDNVVDLVVGRLRRLSPETQRVLSVAAYLGSVFSLRMAALATRLDVMQLGTDVWPALEEGFVVPLGDDYKWMKQEGGAPSARFRFVHDRAQQAAYALVPAEESADLHLQLGRLLLEHSSEDERREHLFEIADHLNRGLALITDPAERLKLAELNLAVAKRAKSSSAYEPAMSYIEAGLRCLPADSWEHHYDLTFALRIEKGELEYLLARWEASIDSLSGMLTHVTKRADRARVRSQMCLSYRMKNDIRQALGVGIEALREFGVDISLDATPEEVASDTASVYADCIVGKDIESYFELPEMTDPEQLAIVEVMVQCMPAAYFLGSPLVFSFPPKMLAITVRHGISPFTSLAFLLLSSNLAAKGQYALARRFGQVGLRIHDEKYPVRSFEAMMMTIWGGYVLPFTSPLADAREYLVRGYHSGIENGAYQFGGYCAFNAVINAAWGTVSLSETRELLAKFVPVLAKIDMAQLLCAIRATVGLLRDSQAGRRYEYSNEEWPNHEAVLQRCREQNDLFTLFLDATCKLTLANWFDDREAAPRYAELAAKYVIGGIGIYGESVFYLHVALSAARYCDGKDPCRDTEQIKKAEEIREKFVLWSKLAPMTFDHQRLMIEAEIARAKGQFDQASDLYDLAIAGADENGFLHNHALAAELAANFYLARGRRRLAAKHFAEACDVYERWGATAKVVDLQQRYGDLLRLAVRSRSALAADGTVHESTSATAAMISGFVAREGALDIMTVVKASQALSEEVVLPRLLDKLMRIVIENAGAQTGVLLLPSDQGLAVHAVGSVQGDSVVVTGQTSEDVPVALAVCQYAARTGESVVLHDALSEGEFRQDASMQARKTRSVLSVPMTRQGRTIAVVYLENNLVAGAFTPARVETLKVLAGQIAISIENAGLYANLESKVEERTAQLAGANHSLEQLLDNMRQGIVAFGPDGRIDGRFSREASNIFGTNIKEGLPIVDVLFAGVPTYDARREAFVEFLEIGFRTLTNGWATAAALLPKEVEIFPGTDRARVLLCEFRPIVETGDITRIMVLALDDTERRRLERDAALREAAHTREMALMKKLVSGGAHLFVTFLRVTEERLTRFAEAVSGEAMSRAKLDELFQHAHTIKGEARAYELRELEATCAEMEGVLAAVRGTQREAGGVFTLTNDVQEQLLSGVARARAAIRAVRHGLVEASPIGEAVLDQIPVSRRDVEGLLEATSKLDSSSCGPVSEVLAPIVDRLTSRPFGEST
ncbi:MAG TPA: AAA family ATPase, partial [Labilithrix sp.]|nr:AAA family ATPase [Labilithrix sp.]